MVTDPPFRETRRDPTDRRSWEQTPAFAGDVAAYVDSPTQFVVVTGVLPRNRMEVVSVERAKRAVGEVRSLDDVNRALAERRIMPRALPPRELAPVTEGIVDAVAELDADADSEVPA
jgi:hypothetical protein